MAETDASQFYTVSSAARTLDVSPSTVWRWIEAKKLPAYRVGPKKIRIKKDDLETLIRPARAKREEANMDKERSVFEPPTQGELTKRQSLVAQILARRQERGIAPRTTSELVRKVRDQEKKSYASR
ncbi:MAG: helix-turn-helix domain-containing protein [Dehalococcoidia bacterium]|nr:helix-turn-helix domain-containing protein [Dehalococcoidia bacterium]